MSENEDLFRRARRFSERFGRDKVELTRHFERVPTQRRRQVVTQLHRMSVSPTRHEELSV